jgi:hypothetical protein
MLPEKSLGTGYKPEEIVAKLRLIVLRTRKSFHSPSGGFSPTSKKTPKNSQNQTGLIQINMDAWIDGL